MIGENIKMALRSIAGSKLRTFLTMLGIIIGVSAVVTINSIGQGLKSQVGDQVSGLGANVIFVLPGQVLSTDKKGKQSFNPTASLGNSTLTNNDVTAIGHIQGVQGVAPLSLISGVVGGNGTQDTSALLLGTTANFTDVLQNPKIDKGRALRTSDQYSTIVGPTTRDTLFGKGADALGKQITLRDSKFTIVGVTASNGSSSPVSTSPGFDDAVFIPLGTVKAVTGNDPSIFRIIVKADSESDVQPVVDKIKAKLKSSHGGQEDFSVLTQSDLLSTVNTILSALTSSIAAIASIALLVGGIGIMNIMLVSVTERTREVGLRKALGATSNMVLSQFLIEAVVLCVLGGAIGVGLAFGAATGAGKLIKITPVFTPGIILVAFIISVVIGIIFGIAPAIKAARMNPIDALRYE